MSVTVRCGVPKERSVYRLSGLGSRILYGVHNNNRTNIVRAVMERVFYVTREGVSMRTPRPAAGVFGVYGLRGGDTYGRLAEFRRKLVRSLPVLTRIDYEQFIAMYTGRRKAVYTEAWQSLCARGICLYDATLKAFVKAEKVKLTKDEFEFLLDPAPRLIQPRSPRFNVEVGRFIKPLEGLIYKGIGRVWGGPTVMKGFNADDTAMHLVNMVAEFDDWVGIGADASRFDQCVSPEALQFEHSVYLACFRGDERSELSRLLSWQLVNRGVAFAPDGKIQYTVEGNRMSGDMNTALGNCLLMCAMVWAFCEAKGIKARLANNGDDCMIFMRRKDEAHFREGFSEWMLEMGFAMVLEPSVYELEKVEFCQANPIHLGGGKWRMVRAPNRSLAKDAYSVLSLGSGAALNKHCSMLGQCGLSLNSGVPILQSYFQALIRAGGGATGKDCPQYETGMFNLAKGMSSNASPVTEEARFSFYLAFGVTPDDQISREAWYDSWTLDSSIPSRPTGNWFDHHIPEALSTYKFNYGA